MCICILSLYLTSHPAIAEVFEHNDCLAHPQEQLCLVFGKMGADHSDSGQGVSYSKVNELTELKLGNLRAMLARGGLARCKENRWLEMKEYGVMN